MSAETLPLLNAILNGIATALLLLGYRFIRRREYAAHGYTMAAAFAVSALFLVGYLTHKVLFGDKGTAFVKPDWLRYAYLLLILIPHVILAAAMVPMILLTLYRAYQRDWTRHRRLARITLPVWLYVSVTGVLIYVLLYHAFPAIAAGR